TLLALGQLSDEEPSTRISWAIRGADPASVYGGGDQDGLPARGALGSQLRNLVESGHVEVHTSMTITGLESSDGLTITATPPEGHGSLQADRVVPRPGFRRIRESLLGVG